MNRLPLFAVILSGLFIGTADAAAANSRPPNIVFFLCDDLGTGDVGALGGKDIQTPNIDALFIRLRVEYPTDRIALGPSRIDNHQTPAGL